jgi:uncharacterized protein YndB with AHSA1/START domain
MTTTLDAQVDRMVTIGAARETVFRFFTDSTRWAAWWGAGSTIDPRPGGKVVIVHPGNVQASGEVVELNAPERIVFTYGYASGKPFPPGGSRVTIRLEGVEDGTRLHLIQEYPDVMARADAAQGWRYQLALFANVVANEVHHQAEGRIDDWFTAWSHDDGAARRRLLSHIALPEVRFADRFSHTEGLEDLALHLDAARRFMPGLTLQREGAVRHCQGTALTDWTAVDADGQPKAKGTNVFVFDPLGRIAAVTGFWST